LPFGVGIGTAALPPAFGAGAAAAVCGAGLALFCRYAAAWLGATSPLGVPVQAQNGMRAG